MAKKNDGGMFAELAKQFLLQNNHYGPMGISVASLVKAYHVFRSTDYAGNSENEEGYNYKREEEMKLIMGSTDGRGTGGYFVWSVLAESFDDYLKKMLREEVAKFS